MIQKVLIENFKAIHTGTVLTIQPFTVFIGNNGSGKSSILEALRVLQTAMNSDLDDAFKDWGGLEKIRNKSAYLSVTKNELSGLFTDVDQPVKIALTALVNQKIYEYEVWINFDKVYVVEHEILKCNSKPIFTSNLIGNKDNVEVFLYDSKGRKQPFFFKHDANSLLLSYKGSPSNYLGIEEFSEYIENWQFLYLNAHDMGKPVVEDKLHIKKQLRYDGRNIAEYILWLRDQGEEYFDSLIRKMRFVLPYINNLEPHIVKETINTEIELLLYETSVRNIAIPGWLLSSGTLRILALLAMFETPQKPSVLFVDEIENGLDPRTIGLLLSQIESVFSDKSMQVIVTTHSPYFLDLVPLESIIVSEKDNDGSTYHIPNDEAKLNLWKERFLPGKLYTMGNLTK